MEQMPVDELVKKLCPGSAVIFQNKNAAMVEHRGGLKFIQCNGTVSVLMEEVLEVDLPKQSFQQGDEMKYDELKDALDGLLAYDEGCTDSGIHDEVLRKRCQDFLQALPSKEHRTLVAKLTVEMWLSPEALESGYGPEDASSFLEWLDQDMNCLVPRN